MFEKAIRFISPKWALLRQQDRVKASMLDSAYDGASTIKKSMRNWYSPRGDANASFSESTQRTLIDRCRDAYRNYPLAKAVIDRVKLNSVGTGIRLQCRLDADRLGITKEQANEFERSIEEKFEIWTKHCDIEDTLNFEEFQVLVQTSMLLSGDVFVNTLFARNTVDGSIRLKLQAIENDRVCNPNYSSDTIKIMRGIQINSFGKPTHYHILQAHPGSEIMDAKQSIWKKVSIYGILTGKKRIFHLFDKGSEGRPGLKRGVPFLSNVLDSLRQLSKYTEAELTAAVISSFFSVFIKTESPSQFPSTIDQSTEEEERGEISLSPGAIIDLLPSESIETTNPGRPNSKYEPFVVAITKDIGAAVGIPVEVLTQHFSSSYTAARGSLLQAWQLFKYQRNIVVKSFCQPVYELFLDGLVASGKIDLPNYNENKELYYRATWIGNSSGSIDPIKEVNAAEKRINIGVSTIQKEAEDISNMDWMDVQRQREIENGLRKAAGLNATKEIIKEDVEAEDIEEIGERIKNANKENSK